MILVCKQCFENLLVFELMFSGSLRFSILCLNSSTPPKPLLCCVVPFSVSRGAHSKI